MLCLPDDLTQSFEIALTVDEEGSAIRVLDAPTVPPGFKTEMLDYGRARVQLVMLDNSLPRPQSFSARPVRFMIGLPRHS